MNKPPPLKPQRIVTPGCCVVILILLAIACGSSSAFETIGASWQKRELSWCFVKANAGQRRTAKAAFAEWDKACGLAFSETRDPAQADIVIEACPQGLIANGLIGLAWVHCDSGAITSAWIQINYRDFKFGRRHFDLFTVLCHEIGHAIGLGHSPGSMMDEWIAPREQSRLAPDDIAAVEFLYGKEIP